MQDAKKNFEDAKALVKYLNPKSVRIERDAEGGWPFKIDLQTDGFYDRSKDVIGSELPPEDMDSIEYERLVNMQVKSIYCDLSDSDCKILVGERKVCAIRGSNAAERIQEAAGKFGFGIEMYKGWDEMLFNAGRTDE